MNMLVRKMWRDFKSVDGSGKVNCVEVEEWVQESPDPIPALAEEFQEQIGKNKYSVQH